MFLYACKFGRETELFEAGMCTVAMQHDVSSAEPFYAKSLRSCQGVKLMDGATLHRQAGKNWNPAGQVKLSAWLQQEQSKQDVERLKTIGNIVFPAVARTAMHIIGSQVMSRKGRGNS